MGFWTRPRECWWRRWLFQFHLWSGLTVGAYFVIVCVTGSIIVYKKEMERIQIPRLVHVTAAGQRGSFQGMVDLVKQRYPKARLENAFLYQEPDVSWSFRLATKEGRVQTYVDPYKLTILGDDGYRDKFLQWAYDLHTVLLLKKSGKLLNGIGGFLLVGMCLSGIVVWWPGKRSWRKAFEFATRARWKRKNYDVHKLAGIAAFALLIVVAVTGADFSFPKSYESAISKVTGDPAKKEAPRVTPLAGKAPANLDVVLAAAMREIPEGEATLFRFAAKPGETHSLRKTLPGDWRTIGDNVIYLDPQTAEVVRVDYHRDLPLGVRMERDITGLHYGTFGGQVTRVLWLIVGLVPLILFVSGLLMWWNRSLSKAWARRWGRRLAYPSIQQRQPSV